MRSKERIPIILDILEDHYVDFLIDVGIGEENRSELLDLYFTKRNLIEEFWLKNPDLRLTQVFVNLDIIPNIEGFWYYKEETDYIIEKGWAKFEDIHFWGVNYSKDGKKLPQTIFKRLVDLNTDHILNILKFYDENSTRNSINKKYLKYFEEIENKVKYKDVDNLLNDLFDNEH